MLAHKYKVMLQKGHQLLMEESWSHFPGTCNQFIKDDMMIEKGPYLLQPISYRFLPSVHQISLLLQRSHQITGKNIISVATSKDNGDLMRMERKNKGCMKTWESICETGYPSAIILLTSLFANSNWPLLHALNRAWTTAAGITWKFETEWDECWYVFGPY